jgi:NAD(P)-dependent dehydrogenase (short-subunit alcohol dehydrogenase family)
MSTNRVLFLTGASGGVGRLLVKGLSEAGYDLALHYNQNPKQLEMILASVNPRTRVSMFQADLTDEAQVARMVDAVIAEFGRIDVLVNNAGIGPSALSWKQDLTAWNEILATNLTATMLACKHSLPHMRSQAYGRIINVSSVVAHFGVPGTGAYAASKAGIEGYTRSVAKEVLNKNITANVVAYGYMEAGLIDVLSEEFQANVKKMIPAGKFGPIEDVMAVIGYLASELSTYITGQTLHVNGGMYMNG